MLIISGRLEKHLTQIEGPIIAIIATARDYQVCLHLD